MLVMQRKQGTALAVGNGIEISVLKISGNNVQLGITAPDSVRIRRSERLEEETDYQKERT